MIKHLNKRLTVLLASGVFLLGLAGFGAAYIGQVQEQNRLSDEIKEVQAQTQALTTKNIESQQSALNISMLKYKTDIDNLQKQLNTSLVVSDIFQNILSIGTTSGVRVSSISSGTPSAVTIAGVRYETISLDFSVTGKEQDVYSFIDATSNNCTTSVLKTIGIQVTNAGTPGETEAKFNLSIYSFRGE